MEKGKYIIPVVGLVYTNRGGGEYRCTGNSVYCSEEMKQKTLALGEHIAYMERVTDNWKLSAHGVIQYEDGTIEWNYSAGEHFPY